jgi:hypothetical protein
MLPAASTAAEPERADDGEATGASPFYALHLPTRVVVREGVPPCLAGREGRRLRARARVCVCACVRLYLRVLRCCVEVRGASRRIRGTFVRAPKEGALVLVQPCAAQTDTHRSGTGLTGVLPPRLHARARVFACVRLRVCACVHALACVRLCWCACTGVLACSRGG